MNDVVIEVLHSEKDVTVFVLERGKDEVHKTFKDEESALNFVIQYLSGVEQ